MWRLRRLERLVDDLSSDVTLTSERLVRLDARMRARARKTLQETPEEDERLEPQLADVPAVNGDERGSIREQLRNRARQRGLLPNGRVS